MTCSLYKLKEDDCWKNIKINVTEGIFICNRENRRICIIRFHSVKMYE